MSENSSTTTGSGTPSALRCVVRVPLVHISSPTAIDQAASQAFRQMKEIVRSADPGWTLLVRDLEFVEATPGEGEWATQAFLLFRAVPTRIPARKKLRRR